jgi:hypothetical protein
MKKLNKEDQQWLVRNARYLKVSEAWWQEAYMLFGGNFRGVLLCCSDLSTAKILAS